MKICSHTLAKNEERYIWYALKSVVDYVDEMLVWDTGSSDKTLDIIKSFQKEYPGKVKIHQCVADTPSEVKSLRQEMLLQTKTDWILVLDGDEVWWRESVKEVTKTIREKGVALDSIVVPFINVIGDIFHYQDEKAGQYLIDGKKGFLTIRAINAKIPGLHVDKPYPLEGYYDKDDILIQDRDKKRRGYIEAPYLHFSHLVRSQNINVDKKTLARQHKNKVELGKQFPLDYYYPESFFEKRPEIVFCPWLPSLLRYNLNAKLRVPFRFAKQLIYG